MFISKKIIPIIAAAAALALLSVLLLCGCTKKNEETEPADENISEPAELDIEFDDGVKRPVHFLAAGDNMVHASIYEQALRRGMGTTYNFTYAYSNAANLVKNADLAMINQEMMICNGTVDPSDTGIFNSPPELGDYMMYLGFDIFTIANNHILDYGSNGLSAYFDYWNARPSAVVTGAFRNKEDSERIRTVKANNIVFSILAYTETTNGNILPGDSEYVINYADDIEKIKDDIHKAKQISDICVVSMHWGTKDSDAVSQKQTETAQLLADAGADVIIGTHPHVLRRVEMLDRKGGGKTLCAYSLGNFISGQSNPQTLVGGILEFDVIPESGGFTISGVSVTPVISHYEKGYSNNRLYLYSQYNEELAAKHGVHGWYDFDMAYIDNIIRKNIDSEYLKLS